MPATSRQPRHIVTAVIVAHDGARLLPGPVQALRAQTFAVERVMGVDTGSRDGSGAVLGELIGPNAVFGWAVELPSVRPAYTAVMPWRAARPGSYSASP